MTSNFEENFQNFSILLKNVLVGKHFFTFKLQ